MPEDYPQVVFLGLAERAEQVREGETQGLEIYSADPDGFPWIPYSLFP
jgi:hypothetical protein